MWWQPVIKYLSKNYGCQTAHFWKLRVHEPVNPQLTSALDEDYRLKMWLCARKLIKRISVQCRRIWCYFRFLNSFFVIWQVFWQNAHAGILLYYYGYLPWRLLGDLFHRLHQSWGHLGCYFLHQLYLTDSAKFK